MELRNIGLAVVVLAVATAAQETTWASVNGGSGNFGESFNPSISADGQFVVYRSVGNDDPLDGCWDILLYDVAAGTTTSLTNCDSTNPPSGTSSQEPTISADGGTVAWIRQAIGGPTDPITGQVFVEELGVAPASVVSSSSAGDWANGMCNRPDLSADGTHVVYSSFADNLTPEPVLFGAPAVFTKNRDTGAATLISESFAGGAGGNGISDHAVISADGRYVAFESFATDLLAPGVDTNGVGDIFVRDRDPDGNGTLDDTAGVTVRVSVDSAGVQGNVHSFRPTISDDGRYVCFQSTANNLVPGDTNGFFDTFVHDRDPDENGIYDEGNGTTTRVSVNSLGEQSLGSSAKGAISGDGARVVFESHATNLSPLTNPGEIHIYLRDLERGQTTLVSIDDAGFPANDLSGVSGIRLAIDEDGSHLAFASVATNLDPGDGNTLWDIYLHEACPDISFDLGFAKAPAGGEVPDFTVCGETRSAELVTFRLRQGSASVFCALLYDFASAPSPGFGGTIVPAVPAILGPFVTGADGSLDLAFVVPPVPFVVDVYGQWLIDAPVGGWGISNAREMPFEP